MEQREQGSGGAAEVHNELERILSSERFRHSQRLSRFLQFVVSETLDGRGHELKEYCIGLRVFDKDESFDPRLDPVVRVQAGNLRSRLRDYYEHEGASDRVVIDLPKGAYVPRFEVPAGNPRSLTPDRHTGQFSARTIALAGIVVAAVSAAWIVLWPSEPARLAPERLTFHAGVSTFPALSRDGRLLVYASDHAGNLDLWARALPDGEPIRLTRHEATERQPDIAPDKTRIAFRSERDGGGIYVMAYPAGTERRIADGGYWPRYSPDGKWLAYIRNSRLHVARNDGTESRGIADGLEIRGAEIVWAPDGGQIACVGWPVDRQDSFDWWLVPAFGGRPRPTGAAAAFREQNLGALTLQVAIGDWYQDGLIFYRSGSRGSSRNLWHMPVSTRTGKVNGRARELTFGTASETDPRATADGRIVFVNESQETHVWSFGYSGEGSIGEPQQLTSDLSLEPGWLSAQPRLSTDGTKLLFVSRRAGQSDVYIKNLSTGSESAITGSPDEETFPLLSPDGATVAWVRQEDRRRAIWTGKLDGSNVRRVCDECGRLADWSPDGRHILFAASTPERIYSLDLTDGSRAELISDGNRAIGNAAISPDGRYVAWVTGRGERMWAAAFSPHRQLARGEWISVAANVEDALPQWTAKSDGILFLSERDGYRCLWRQPFRPEALSPPEPQVVRHFHGTPGWPWLGTGVSLGHERYVVLLTNSRASIWMADLR